jgi:hypothetical protein
MATVTPPRPKPTEIPRILVFTTVEFENGDWDGPRIQGDFASYTSKNDAASLRITLNGKPIFDKDYGKGKTFYVDDDVIHLPEGAKGEI